jgi:hypothetical protein
MHKIKGFTGVELLLALVVLVSVFGLIIHFSKRELSLVKGMTIAENSIEYARSSSLFVKTYYMALQDALTDNGDISNGKTITISPQILKDDGFLPLNYPNKNKLNQYPCIVITYNNNQLEAFLFYLSDSKSLTLTNKQQTEGLEHVGGMIGIYRDGQVLGAGKTWNLDALLASKLLVSSGTTEPNIGFDKGNFKCQGEYISNGSFVVNYASLFALKSRLPHNDVLSQYPDPSTSAGDTTSGNTMSADLNMDYAHKQNAVVFQMNQNCKMDPSITASMQDYDPRFDGNNPIYANRANNLGCKNRQLSMRNIQGIRGSEMIVTGFQQGGDSQTYSNYNVGKDSSHQVNQPFVGELKAQAFQPTTAISVGTPCDAVEIGTMARQSISGVGNDVNNLYVSQVICMKNPLCPSNSNGICFMPANSVTITYNIPVVKNDKPGIVKNAINAVTCPAGMAMASFSDDHTNPPDYGRHCCGTVWTPFGDQCYGYNEAHDHVFNGYLFSYLSNTSPNVNPFKNGVKLGIVRYRWTCDAICQCPDSDAAQWQPQVTSITCSNDINRIPVEEYINN